MLQGSRVALTELRAEDSDALYRWINDPAVVQYNAPYEPVHEANHAAWFRDVTKDRTRIVFAIRRLDASPIIGMLQLVDIHPVHRSTELIIRIGEETERGRGAGSEAVRLAVRFAFEHRNLNRVWLRVFANNARGIRAYERAGLQIEGTLRRACFIDGQWLDQIVMAAVAQDGAGS